LNLTNFLAFSGLSKEEFFSIRNDRAEANRKNAAFAAPFGAVAFAVFALTTIRSQFVVPTKIYIIASLVMLVVSVLSWTVSKYSALCSDICTYVAVLGLLFSGLLISFSQPQERTVSLCCFYIIVAVLFSISPLGILVSLSIVEATFLVFITKYQTGMLLRTNILNGIAFCLLGEFCGVYLTLLKCRKLFSERTNQLIFKTDALTGLKNRRAYEDDIDEVVRNMKNDRTKITIGSFDLNGLKKTNDTLGHKAGDELIKGAADCIRLTFEKYGSAYRIGGDEYAAILIGDFDTEALDKEFKNVQNNWHGELVDSISISYGMAEITEYTQEGISEAMKIADKGMYKDKSDYYIRNGLDRRKV